MHWKCAGNTRDIHFIGSELAWIYLVDNPCPAAPLHAQKKAIFRAGHLCFCNARIHVVTCICRVWWCYITCDIGCCTVTCIYRLVHSTLQGEMQVMQPDQPCALFLAVRFHSFECYFRIICSLKWAINFKNLLDRSALFKCSFGCFRVKWTGLLLALLRWVI